MKSEVLASKISKNVALAHPRMARQGEVVIPRRGSERLRNLNKWIAWTNKRMHRKLLFLPRSGIERFLRFWHNFHADSKDGIGSCLRLSEVTILLVSSDNVHSISYYVMACTKHLLASAQSERDARLCLLLEQSKVNSPKHKCTGFLVEGVMPCRRPQFFTRVPPSLQVTKLFLLLRSLCLESSRVMVCICSLVSV